MAKSTYLKNKLLDHELGTTTWTKPTVFLSLHTAQPDPTGTPSNEVTGGSYARQAIAFSAASGGSTSNSGNVSFSSMPACTITHWGLYDASTAGNLLMYGTLAASKVVNSGDTETVTSGTATFSEA